MADNQTTDMDAWFNALIEREKEEARRIAKRDGVPIEWLEAIFAQMEKQNVH